MTLTFTQIVDDNDLYLYPNADNCACSDLANWDEEPFTPIGAYKHLLIDDDKDNPDDDTTYLYIDEEIEECILFDLPNHTTETGTINYIQIYARAKTHQYAMADTGEYKIIISPNATCTDYHESRNFELVTSYKTYTEVWTENPESSATWTWDEIDNLAIGVYIDNDITVGRSKNLTLRPNGNDTINLSDWGGTWVNWENVAEETLDTSDYVMNNTGANYNWDYDLYDTENHTTETGTINKITLFGNMRKKDAGSSGQGRVIIETGGVIYKQTAQNLSTSNTYYSKEWGVNPNTGVAWTWANIDNLLIGVDLYGKDDKHSVCNQLYLAVNYTEDVIPEVRTTQIYARVNYTEEFECTLNKPVSFSSNHNRNVKKLNFWNAQREVYDLSRSNKTLVLEGSEIYSGACDRIQCIRDMGLRGDTVTISGFNPACFDGDYKIRSFGWKEVSKKPARFDWILELESED